MNHDEFIRSSAGQVPAQQSAVLDSVSIPENAATLTHEAINKLIRKLHANQLSLENETASLKKKLDELTAAREHFANLYQSLPVGYCSVLRSGELIESNEAISIALGIAQGELASKSILEFVHNESRGVFQEWLNQLEPGTIATCELRLLRSEGQTFWAKLTGKATNLLDGRSCVYLAVTDISDQKAAEKSQWSTAERLELVLDATRDGIWDWNIHTNEVYFSPQWERLLGYGVKECAPNVLFFFNLVHPDDLERLLQAQEQCLAGQIQWKQLEVRLRMKSGDYKWFLDRGQVAERDAAGRPTRMCGTITEITSEKHDRDRIKENERRLRESQSIARLGSFHWNAKTDHVTWSDQLYRIYGKDPRSFVPSFENYIACIHPEDRERVAKELQSVMSTLGEFDHEYRGVPRDDGVCWVHARGRAIVGEDGEFLGLEGTCQDTTERKRAELERIEALDRLEKIASRVPGMVYEFRRRPDGKTSFPYASDGMRKIFRVRPGEVVESGSKIFACIHPDDLATLDLSIQKSAMDMTLWSLEFRLKFPDGTERWVSGNSVPTLEPDGSTLWHGYLADITDRKNSELANRVSEAKFRAIIDASPVPMAIVDENEIVYYLNPAFVNTFGYDARSIPNLDTWRQLAYPDTDYRNWVVEIWKQHLDEARVSGKNFAPIELFVRCSNGLMKLVMAGATPILGDFAGLNLFLVQDITERKQAEQNLIEAHAAAEAASRAKSSFLANMSHEIRTPLTAMLGFADILGDSELAPQSVEQRKNILETIKRAGNHLLTIINDILDLSKIEANKMTVEVVETSLIGLLVEVETLMSSKASGKGVRLSVSFANRLPERIQSDPTRMRQILLNLVGNSTKFTEAGSIDIRAGVQEDHRINWLYIDIEDTGLGMTREQTERLFTPFGQGDNSMTRTHGGTGLGLSLSRRLAKMMGGDIQLKHSVLGSGSCFRIVLPLIAAEHCDWYENYETAKRKLACGAAEAKPSSTKQVLKGRILLAEDGIDNQRLIAFHLRTAGAHVETADNGRIALDIFEKAEAEGNPFDLLVSDMQMPEMDGYTLARTLRDRGATLPIVALTANAMSDDKEKCLQAGCDDYSTKPINKPALLKLCETWLASARIQPP